MTNGAIANVQKSVCRRLEAYHQRRIHRLHMLEASANTGA
jgi:hypothetical protein